MRKRTLTAAWGLRRSPVSHRPLACQGQVRLGGHGSQQVIRLLIGATAWVSRLLDSACIVCACASMRVSTLVCVCETMQSGSAGCHPHAGSSRARMRLSFSKQPRSAQPCGPAAAPGGAAGAAAAQQPEAATEPKEARQRPLVVVVDRTEACDMASLQDLILVLSEVGRIT